MHYNLVIVLHFNLLMSLQCNLLTNKLQISTYDTFKLVMSSKYIFFLFLILWLNEIILYSNDIWSKSKIILNIKFFFLTFFHMILFKFMDCHKLNSLQQPPNKQKELLCKVDMLFFSLKLSLPVFSRFTFAPISFLPIASPIPQCLHGVPILL